MDVIGMFKQLENALDAASLRQQVIANNIANAGTPNFKTQGVAFEDELKKALASNDDPMSFGVKPVSMNEDLSNDEDFVIDGGVDPNKVRAKVYDTGNNVDMNKEMVNLARNQIHYNMLTDKLGGFMGIVQTVIETHGK
ncbi:MAG: flagellar basal body rod protein FlgB [Vulcanimicrobiota bacterium]